MIDRKHGVQDRLGRMRGMFAAALLLCAGRQALADIQCQPRGRLATPLGELSQVHCADNGNNGVDRWSLGSRVLLESPAPVMLESADSRQALLVLSAATDSKTGCPANLFLLDFNGKSPRVFRFGVQHACNTFKQASWGKRSVIAIKHNVHFYYTAGRLTPPAHDAGLMENLLFSAYGGNPAFEQIVPFVTDMTPPAGNNEVGR